MDLLEARLAYAQYRQRGGSVDALAKQIGDQKLNALGQIEEAMQGVQNVAVPAKKALADLQAVLLESQSAEAELCQVVTKASGVLKASLQRRAELVQGLQQLKAVYREMGRHFTGEGEILELGSRVSLWLQGV